MNSGDTKVLELAQSLHNFMHAQPRDIFALSQQERLLPLLRGLAEAVTGERPCFIALEPKGPLFTLRIAVRLNEGTGIVTSAYLKATPEA